MVRNSRRLIRRCGPVAVPPRRYPVADGPGGELGQLLPGGVLLALHLDLEARRLRHPAAQVNHGAGRHRAQCQEQPPGQARADAGTEEGQRDERPDDQPQGLGGEDEADQPAAVLAVGVLGHQHRADRVVAAHTHAEQEPEADQHPERRRQGRANRGDRHHGRDQPVHPLAADHVGDPAEDQGAQAGGAQHGRVQQREPAGVQVPVLLDQRRRDSDDEQVIGVGEEAHPGDKDRPQVEPVQRCVIQGSDEVTGSRLRHVVPFSGRRAPLPGSCGDESTSFWQIATDGYMNGK